MPRSISLHDHLVTVSETTQVLSEQGVAVKVNLDLARRKLELLVECDSYTWPLVALDYNSLSLEFPSGAPEFLPPSTVVKICRMGGLDIPYADIPFPGQSLPAQ